MDLYTNIEYVDKPVSRMFFGTQTRQMTMGEDSAQLLDDVYAAGIQTFDTARAYTASEKVLGDWMKLRGNRNELVILSKCGHPSPFGRPRVNETDIRKDLERSLRYLQTDYIDIYLLHRDDESIPAGESVEIFNRLHQEGKIGAFGASNWSTERIRQANAYAKEHGLIPFTVSSPHFGLAEQVADPWGGNCVSITGAAKEADRAWYRETQMPVISYSSLGRGMLSGRFTSAQRAELEASMDAPARAGYVSDENFERLKRCEELAAQKGATVAQIALAWMFEQGLNLFTIVATTKGSRMQENMKALDIALTDEECAWLNLEVDR